VVGNGAYAKSPLATAANDAGLIAQTLQAAGFDVIGARDLDGDTLRKSFRDFINKAEASGPDTVAMVYLAGYGLQLAGDNYFVPVDSAISRDTDVPAVVSVSEDHRSGGQVWSRLYGRRNGFPQVIHSAKRFAGVTGIEEYVGHGVGMALKVEALADGLRFISDHYFLTIAGRRLRLPRWIEPGQTVVEHHDLGHGCFRFSLKLHHPWLGRLVEQHALFRDA